MTILFKDNDMPAELADEVINASSVAVSYFHSEGRTIFNFNNISAVELYIFYVCQTWFMLHSHLTEKGADTDDLMSMLSSITYKFTLKAVSMVNSKDKKDDVSKLTKDDAIFWGAEFKKNLNYYQQVVAEGGVDRLMRTAFKDIIKSDQELESDAGKIFLGSVYATSVHIEEKLNNILV